MTGLRLITTSRSRTRPGGAWCVADCPRASPGSLRGTSWSGRTPLTTTTAGRSSSGSRPIAGSLIGPYKTECTKREGPWRGVDDLELATLSWVHWFNTGRLHGSSGYVPPLEFETAHYRRNTLLQQPLPGRLSPH